MCILVVDVLYKYVFENKKEREEGVVYVTDLCRCPLKSKLEHKYPNLIDPFKPVLLLGQIVHIGLEKLLQDYTEAELEVEKRVKLEKFTIAGRIDAIIDNTGVEIKYSASDAFIPYEHHILQCKIYNWLFDLSKTILVYVTPERITEFNVEERVNELEVLKLIEDDKSPRFSWECSYCEFSRICPNKVKKQK